MYNNMYSEAASMAKTALGMDSWAMMGDMESKASESMGDIAFSKWRCIDCRSDSLDPSDSFKTLVRIITELAPVVCTRASGCPRFFISS